MRQQTKIYDTGKHGIVKIVLDDRGLFFHFDLFQDGNSPRIFKFTGKASADPDTTSRILQKAFDHQTITSASNIVTIAKQKLAN